MFTFLEFRRNPSAVSACHRLLRLEIDNILTWDCFMQAALDNRSNFEGDSFVDHVRTVCRTTSSGETALALAILVAVDYRWLAEEISQARGRSFLSFMEDTTGSYARAAAACLVRDERPISVQEPLPEGILSSTAGAS